MNIFEMFDKAPEGYYDEKEDNSGTKMSDSRAGTRLTLAHIHQLRLSHDVRKLEHEKKLQKIAKQYAPAPEAGATPLGV